MFIVLMQITTALLVNRGQPRLHLKKLTQVRVRAAAGVALPVNAMLMDIIENREHMCMVIAENADKKRIFFNI